MTPVANLFRALPASGKGLALLLSVSVHAAVALAAARGAPHAPQNASLTTDSVLEIVAPDLTAIDAPVPPTPSPTSARAPHHHDYPVAPDHDEAPHDPALRHVVPGQRTPSAAPAADPTVLVSPTPAAPRFAMTVGAATHAALGSNVSNGVTAMPGSDAPAEPAAEASVDTPARLLVGSSASYTREAEAAGIEADVPLEIVVDSAGSVIGARALAHVGYGLDEAALRSVRSYRFSPARRASKAIAVRMRWLMRFQLR